MERDPILSAEWIASPCDTGEAAVVFAKSFSVNRKIRKCTVSASSVGVYTLHANGERVGRGVLTPGWTSYEHRIQYQEYDITDMIRENNLLELGVGQGWAVGYMGYQHTNHCFSDRVAAVAAIYVEYSDGVCETLLTDSSWMCRTSEVTFSDIYNGETVDMTAPTVALGHAVPVEVSTSLVPQSGEWICEQDVIYPRELIITPRGERVIDFGQNMTGYVEVRLKAERGARIVIHHAEVLDRDGNFHTANYRKAKNEVTYICSGGEDTFKPRYSFQGFRYIRLSEYPCDVSLDSFRAIAVYSDIERTGYFNCGNEKINQLYHNVIWGQKSNYLDIPTDCPQRDERLGWTGDTQVFAKTAAINYDVKKFLAKWLEDVALEQEESGAVRGVVPSPFGKIDYNTRISAAWGDAACVVPWELYLAYGDTELLRRSFGMMKKWVEYMHSSGEEEYLWLGGFHYGDWLAMDGSPDEYVGQTPTDFIASLWFAYSASLLINAGEVLGEDMSAYKDMHAKIKQAIRERYFRDGLPVLYKNGSVDEVQIDETQTAYVLSLKFGICNEDERAKITEALVKLIRKKGTRITTGFVGTPYILHVLSDNGRTDVAYELLMQEESPSWLYSVCHGATTMWEHWNSIKEDCSFWSDDMNSFNHYAYGAVYDWIFGVAVGIKPQADRPAYERITLAPHPSRVLGFAEASYRSRYGEIRVRWYYRGDEVFYDFDIPDGVTAELTLPSGRSMLLTGGKYHFAE